MSNLRSLTANKLQEVESHPFYQKLLSGQITDERYAIYLWEQLGRYDAIEDWLEPLGIFSGMEALKRYEHVRDDFEEIWKGMLGKKTMPQPSRSTTDMQKRIKHLVEDDINDTMQALAHAYAMHGDLLELSTRIDLNKLPGANKMFQFSESVDSLRAKLDAKLTDAMAEEVNYSYDLKIRMFNFCMDCDPELIVHGNRAGDLQEKNEAEVY